MRSGGSAASTTCRIAVAVASGSPGLKELRIAATALRAPA
jgi:hypothetical protein